MSVDDAKLLKAVGRRIAELRAERGWNQEQFAERYRVTIKYVQALELGVENLTLTSMARIARILGIRVADLLVPPKSLVARRGRPPKLGAPQGIAPSAKSQPVRGKAAGGRARTGR